MKIGRRRHDSKQLPVIYIKSIEMHLPLFLSVQKDEEKAFSDQVGREDG